MMKEKRQALIKFVLLYVVSILLIATMFYAYTSSSQKEQSDQYEGILSANDLLNNYLNQLHNLNEEYIKLSAAGSTASSKDSLHKVESKLKEAINLKIDSIITAGNSYDKNIQTKYTEALLKFDTAFRQWQTLNTLILSIKPADTSNSVTAKSELEQKDQRIALIESRLNAAQLKEKSASANAIKDQQEIRFLKWAVRSQVETIKNLENRLKKL